jgi:hypothetical protein
VRAQLPDKQWHAGADVTRGVRQREDVGLDSAPASGAAGPRVNANSRWVQGAAGAPTCDSLQAHTIYVLRACVYTLGYASVGD